MPKTRAIFTGCWRITWPAAITQARCNERTHHGRRARRAKSACRNIRQSDRKGTKMESRVVEAVRGWRWIVEGFALFRRTPLIWVVLTIVLFAIAFGLGKIPRSEEHTSELQSRFGISYAL